MGPGFSPVPAKLVNQIVAGKYIDLSELLAANLVHAETVFKSFGEKILWGWQTKSTLPICQFLVKGSTPVITDP